MKSCWRRRLDWSFDIPAPSQWFRKNTIETKFSVLWTLGDRCVSLTIHGKHVNILIYCGMTPKLPIWVIQDGTKLISHQRQTILVDGGVAIYKLFCITVSICLSQRMSHDSQMDRQWCEPPWWDSTYFCSIVSLTIHVMWLMYSYWSI